MSNFLVLCKFGRLVQVWSVIYDSRLPNHKNDKVKESVWKEFYN